MTKIEKQLLGNQCVIMAALAKSLHDYVDEPEVIDTLTRMANSIEETLDLIETWELAP